MLFAADYTLLGVIWLISFKRLDIRPGLKEHFEELRAGHRDTFADLDGFLFGIWLILTAALVLAISAVESQAALLPGAALAGVSAAAATMHGVLARVDGRIIATRAGDPIFVFMSMVGFLTVWIAGR